MIRRAETDADLAAYAEVWSAVRPREPISGAEVRKRLARSPERLHVVAELDGAVVGCGAAGRTSSPGRGFAFVSVVSGRRRRGLGSELLAACLEHARTLGFDAVGTTVWEDDPESLAWAERRGFVEVGREV
jgi:predicted N-acetyltransferase YhbS